uniref:Uncharacterized protein n=1 Tax=Cyprinus carpio TaxID=7962 RepID=A0A8C2KQR1_CYPCA
MRAAIGSQCKLINRGVTCILFGSLKINLAAFGSPSQPTVPKATPSPPGPAEETQAFSMMSLLAPPERHPSHSPASSFVSATATIPPIKKWTFWAHIAICRT